MISYSSTPSAIESSYEFAQRAKSLMQEMGYSNNVKITNELYEDSRIKNIYTESEYGSTSFYIFPEKLSEIDDIIDAAGHIVEYYKGSTVELKKPSLLKFAISGIADRLSSIDHESVISSSEEKIKIYLGNIESGCEIKKSQIISLINDAVISVDSSYSITANEIQILTYFYSGENYSEYIYQKEMADTEIAANPLAISLSSIT